jgi:hypothetical protein
MSDTLFLVNPTEDLSSLEADCEPIQDHQPDVEGTEEDLDDEELGAPEVGLIIREYLTSLSDKIKQNARSWYSKNMSCWARPKDPAYENFVKAKSFYYPDVFVWLPRGFDVDICCPYCHVVYGNGNIEVKGYPPPRRIIGMDKCYYLMTTQHQCNRCSCK